MLPKASLTSIVKEEISLEGLEGSTLNTLWNRIAVRLEMTMPLPQPLMVSVWSMVLRSLEFEFYLLLAARKPYAWFDRLANVDADTGIPLHPSQYPGHRFKYNPIEGNGVRGSCEEYGTRTPIPREELLSITSAEAEERYGLKFTIVASQRMRESFLIHPNCTVELTLMQYCMLEWIGRSRFNGETSHGKFSLLEVTGDSSSMFYHRKALSNAKLITRQNLSIRTDDISIQGMVLHLPRYYNEMKSMQLQIAERVATELKRRKYYMADYEEIKLMLLGRPDAGKLFRTPEFQRYIKTDEMVAYRELHPGAPPSAWQTKRGEEKLVRIMRLIEPAPDVHDREGHDEAEKSAFLVGADSSVLHVDVPLFRLAYSEVAKANNTGISQSELAAKLGLDRLSARGVVKNLTKLNAIESQSVDEGRQRLAKFFLPGRAQRSAVYDQELNQFVSNQKQVAENERQQQASSGAEDSLQSALTQLLPAADRTVSYETVITANNGTVGADGSLAPVDLFDSKAQDITVTSVTLTDKLREAKAATGISEALQSGTVSELFLRRCNFIIELVKQEQAIEPRTIVKKLNARERLAGSKYEACNKSIARMIGRLAADRLVVIAKVAMRRDEREYAYTFVCDPNISLDQSALQSRINMTKARILLQSQMTGKEPARRHVNPVNVMELRGNSGCLSKCLRMKLFHEYLFYLVYEHPRNARELATSELTTVDLTGLEGKELSSVYSDTNDWRMFVPPLDQNYDQYGDGWVVLTDVFVRMPLGIFCSICAFSFYTNDLDYYLDHPIRRYYLIKHLPAAIRAQLLTKRRYIYIILETTKLLCCAGLLQMGPHLAKVRDQTLVYVNRRTALLDTTASQTGYNEIEDREYPRLSFRFESLVQVKDYWKKLYEIATGTRINTRSTAIGREILVQHLYAKPAMVEAVREKTPQEALAHDGADQLPPGDRKGAAGMDSAMFMHLKSNWHKLINFTPPIDRHRLKRVRKALLARKKPAGGAASAGAGKGGEGKRLTLKMVGGGMSGGAGRGVPTVSKKLPPRGRTAKLRLIRAPKMKLRRVWENGYDDVDDRALKLMNKLRCSWTRIEDHLLLVCRVAMLYLYRTIANSGCPLNSANYRDILHWANGRSLSKTSRACQRRVNYMMTKLHGYANQVHTMLEESKLDAEITARYGLDFVQRLRERFPQQDDYIMAIRIHYVQLVHLLRTRFARQLQGDVGRVGRLAPGSFEAKPSSSGKRTLPNNLAEFYRQYDVIETSSNGPQLNYDTDPATVEELARYKLTIVMHSAFVNRRMVSDELLQHILERYVESSVVGAMRLLRNYQLVSLSTWARGNVAKVAIANAAVARDKRVYHLSISYQQQMVTSIPFELFVPLFDQLATLLGRERFAEERYECEDGGDGMVLLLSELIAVGQVELSIDQAANYIEMRPDAVQGNSEVLSQLRGQGFSEVPGEPAEGNSPASPAKRRTRGKPSGEVVSQLRGQGFLEPAPVAGGKPLPRKSATAKQRSSTRGTGAGPSARPSPATKGGSRSVRFSANQDVTFQYVMHPLEQLAKLPIEYFHFFCLLEQLKVADRRLLAQTFKIDELHPTACSLPNCTIASGTAGVDLLACCMALVCDRREQLDRIRGHGGGGPKGATGRQSRIDAAQFFDVREDNLMLFFGKYVDEFQHRAGLRHKRDINRQQQLLGPARAPVNMAELLVECLAFDEELPQYDWLDRCVVSTVPVDAVDDEDEQEPDDEGEDDRQTNDMLSALTEKVFKLHNFYEVTSKKIQVQVRPSPHRATGAPFEREAYGLWRIPRAFLPEGAKRRKEILLKVASDAVWPLVDQLAPLMTEAMTLIERNLHACALLDFILKRDKLGSTVMELAAAFPNHGQLEQHLRTLQSFRFLLRTGFRHVTYVHWRFADEWLTKSQIRKPGEPHREPPSEPSEPVAGPSGGKRKAPPGNPWEQDQERNAKKYKLEKERKGDGELQDGGDEGEGNGKSNKSIQIAMAPWIQIDGTLNKRLLYRWLCSVLLYCVAHPGVPFIALFKRFNMMSPFHLRQLLEMLQDYGCVSLHSMQCNMTKTLFTISKPAKIVPASEFVSDEQTYIETPPNALSTLSLCIGEYRKYTQDFYDQPVRKTARESEAARPEAES